MIDTMARIRKALGDRYVIVRELGAGGMATVYLARDIKHDRDVAIKVLKPELAKSIAGERFLREIGICARLSHPHVLPLLDSGVASNGELLYYVMPVATGESLGERIRRDGRLPVDEALRFATEISDALVHAHEHGVIHRDVKPDNVLISGGHAVVVDFGIAKALGQTRDNLPLTTEGMSVGTPVYMAPEQASVDGVVDHRADVYAVGAILFEMLSGAPPFAGAWQQVVIQKIGNDAPSLASRWPEAPPALVQLVARCLSSDVSARPQTAQALLRELRALSAPPAAQSRLKLMVAVAVLIVAVMVSMALYFGERRTAWVHETALPTIARQIEADQLDSAFALASEVAARAPDDSTLATLWPRISQTQAFFSEPAGAVVTRAALDDTTRWLPVGTTPSAPLRIPNNAWYYRYTLAGYRTVTVMGARLGGSYVPIPSPVAFRRVSEADSDMVLLRGQRLVGTMYGLSPIDTFNLPDYLMNVRETTNREYKLFVDAGGYTNRAWWDSAMVRDGKPLAWQGAMQLFVDRTGRAGPAGWEGGAPAADTEDLPVGGVSWYEARAFARFAKKDLPTMYEWNAAAIPEAARWVVPHGRYEATGPVRGGAARSVSPRGVYDMAGNVREWTVNARSRDGNRYILGGGWSDPQYLFSELYAQPAFDRSLINGIRLIRRLGASPDVVRASAPIAGIVRDYATMRPVDDATYRGILAMYEYDHTPLNPTVVVRDTTAADWVREDIEFDVPGSAMRMRAALFLPKRIKAPFQTVVLWPASDVFSRRDPANIATTYVDYFVRSGRALLYPIYEHTYARGTAMGGDHLDGSIAHRDQMFRWSREMRRSIDYVTTRSDIDSTRIAFAGVSWGARLAGVMLAIEPRFRAAVLNVPGLSMMPMRPEEDPVNFLPRVRIPVLMLSGKYDSTFPYELSQVPFYRRLGTPDSLKKHVLYEGGHFLPRPLMVQEGLSWLDKYLGPVARD